MNVTETCTRRPRIQSNNGITAVIAYALFSL